MKTELNQFIKEAMLSKNVTMLKVLRLIKAEFMNFGTAKNAKELNDDAEIGIIKAMIKQRKSSIVEYTTAERFDLVEQEQEEIDILDTFLPKMLSEDELKDAINLIIDEKKISDMKGMGIVIGGLKSKYGASFDAGLANKVFKSILNI